MSIYRGPGGSGDATNDAASQAVLATQKAAEAAASASSSALSASQAASYAADAQDTLDEINTIFTDGDLTVDTIKFTGSAAGEGILSWNDVDNTLNLSSDSGDVMLQIGQEKFVRVSNQTGATLTNGTIVYQNNGASLADHLTVGKFIANGSIEASLVIGMLTNDIPNNGEGFATVFGKVRQLNTSAFNVGDIVYASDTVPGGITTIQPISPSETVILGSVIKKDSVNGEYFINIRLSPDADTVTYDNSSSGLVASNVKAALDELQLEKVNVADLNTSLTFYLTSATASVAGYRKMVTSVTDPDFNVSAFNLATGAISVDNLLIEEWVSAPNLISGNPGTLNVTILATISKSAGAGGTYGEFFFRIYHRTSGGTETLMATSSTTGDINPSLNIFGGYVMNATVPFVSFSSTDSIVVKIYANTSAGNSSQYNIQLGDGSPTRVQVPIPITVVPTPSALGILTDTSTFNNILSGASSNVQAALNTLDDHTHSYASLTGSPSTIDGGTY